MKVYKIKDREDLVKDPVSGAILLSQTSIANDYKIRKKSIDHQRSVTEELNTLKEKMAELDTIKKDMQDIKSLLQGIANKWQA